MSHPLTSYQVICLQGIIYFGDKSNVIRPSHTWNTSKFGLCIWIREITHVPKTELPTIRDIVLGALDSYSVYDFESNVHLAAPERHVKIFPFPTDYQEQNYLERNPQHCTFPLIVIRSRVSPVTPDKPGTICFSCQQGRHAKLNKHLRYPISETPITSFTSSDRSSIHIWTSPFFPHAHQSAKTTSLCPWRTTYFQRLYTDPHRDDPASSSYLT